MSFLSRDEEIALEEEDDPTFHQDMEEDSYNSEEEYGTSDDDASNDPEDLAEDLEDRLEVSSDDVDDAVDESIILADLCEEHSHFLSQVANTVMAKVRAHGWTLKPHHRETLKIELSLALVRNYDIPEDEL